MHCDAGHKDVAISERLPILQVKKFWTNECIVVQNMVMWRARIGWQEGMPDPKFSMWVLYCIMATLCLLLLSGVNYCCLIYVPN